MLTIKSIKQSVYDIISFGIVARILNFFKGILLAYYIGANYKTDTYLIAFSATMLLTKIIADGLTISLVPTFQEIDRRDGQKGRNEFANNMINCFIVISIALIILGMILAPAIIKILGPGFKGDDLREAVKLFRIGLPIITFHFIRAIFGGYLQSLHKFKSGAKSGVINAIIYIIYLVTISKYFGLEGLMVAGVISVIGQVYIMYKGSIKAGYKYKYYISFKDRQVYRVFTFLLPIIVSIGINEIIGAVDNAMGSVLEKGTIAELNYANSIISLIVGLFIVAIVTAIYPILAENYNKYEDDDLKQSINYSIRLIFLIAIPTTIILITLAVPIVKLFYERGAFGITATINTAELLRYYSIGIIGTSLILLLTRVFYAIHDLNTPVKLLMMALISNIIFNYILMRLIGAKGIALGTAFSVLLTSAYGIFKLNWKISFIPWDDIFIRLFKYFIAGVIMTSVVTIIYSNLNGVLGSTFAGNLILVILSAFMGVASFSGVVWVTKA